jgi:hypothetical protein
LLHTEKIKFINKINASKTLAQLGEGGLSQMVGEGDLRTENVRKLGKLNKALIRPVGHLLPGRKVKNMWG